MNNEKIVLASDHAGYELKEKIKKYLIENEEDANAKRERGESWSKDFGKDIITSMLRDNQRLFAYEFEGYWKDVGTLDSLWEANMDLLSPALPLGISRSTYLFIFMNLVVVSLSVDSIS